MVACNVVDRSTGRSKRTSRVAIGLMTGLTCVLSIWTAESRATDHGENGVGNGSVVGWNAVHSAFGHDSKSSRSTATSITGGSLPAATVRRNAGDFAVDRVDAALPPPPREGLRAASVSVHPSSLAGISSSVIPAVTGDLYWSRPTLDMRVIGQSFGQNSTLRLSRPSVGVAVGSTSNNPPFVGIK